MTTLVIDYKLQEVHADKACTIRQNGLLIGRGKWQKAYKDEDHIIVCCGDLAVFEAFVEAYRAESYPPQSKGAAAIIYVVRKRDKGLEVDKYEGNPSKKLFGKPYTWKVSSLVAEEDYTVDGSGDKFCMGALKAGLTPVEAIKVASRLDPHTGSDVLSLNFKEEWTL